MDRATKTAIQHKAMMQMARESCPELQDLPPGWTFDFDVIQDNRIYFIKTGEEVNTFAHPARGPLPGRWVLKLVRFPEDWKTIYLNRETNQYTRNDVRIKDRVL